jgi:protein-S-isoprenylcysteine O-methyltransferase Ste14
MTRARGPGVRFPPPFVFVAGYLAAWWLHSRLPAEIDGAGAGLVQVMLGMSMLALGLGLVAWGLATFARLRTAVYPDQPARQLVTVGPYRFSRNPMYLGLTLLYVGIALVSNLAWPIVMLPFVLGMLGLAVIRREERYLQAEFGAAYDEYCARVRRWI